MTDGLQAAARLQPRYSPVSCPYRPRRSAGFTTAKLDTVQRGYKGQKYSGKRKDKLKNVWNLSSQMAGMHPGILRINFKAVESFSCFFLCSY